MTKRNRLLFQAFKYAIYALLAMDVGLFFVENVASTSFTNNQGLSFSDIIISFTDTIDTAAWLVLLLLLELETYVIPDEKIHGPVDMVLTSLSFACGAIILYSFYGYIGTLGVPLGFTEYNGPDPCGLISTGVNFASSLDAYTPLGIENCAQLASGAFFNADLNMFASADSLSLMKRLAWLDVLNAAVWIIIVIVLELEVFLQSSKLVGTKFFAIYKWSKLLLYGTLAINVFYWGYLGQSIEAWDAFLWLIAFFFIEMNLLSWQEEVASSHKSDTADNSPLNI